ncbi:hypothetical protein ANCCEY_02818 [Ancylostoma ceylanicum]|uniref:Uncharacterized protein n=1 Tax=Ancylostoma ceylanicum TaxID=53326 RepID=A0A0D6M6P0_9BILA|nr:hypothetical protein ANCCEY_02818 [Ancylostoma ceylanicum]
MFQFPNRYETDGSVCTSADSSCELIVAAFSWGSSSHTNRTKYVTSCLPTALPAAQQLAPAAQPDPLSHVLHQYQTVAAAANPSAAAATQYFYQPLATLLPYSLPGGSTAFAASSRQPQYVSFAPAAQSLVPQFVPVSIMDPTVLAAQAQVQWQGAAAATGSQLIWPAPTIFPPATELFMPSLQAMAGQRAATQFNQVFKVCEW